jgi:DNA-binding GntR family transcriptional regulator
MKKIKRGQATNEVYKKIKNMMYYNEIVPGQKLIYQDLADKFKISATPVIQALKRLEYSNLVYYQENKGYFVGEITPNEVKELYDAREALEIKIVPSIIQNLTQKKLNQIKKAARTLKPKDEDRRFLILNDARFHLDIAKNANNKVIQRLLTGIFEEICLKYRPEYMVDERLKESIEEHRAILEAFEKKDAEKAIKEIIRHNRSGCKYVAKSISNNINIF